MRCLAALVHLGRERPVLADLAARRFRWLSPAEGALAAVAGDARGQEALRRASAEGIWLAGAFVEATPPFHLDEDAPRAPVALARLALQGPTEAAGFAIWRGHAAPQPPPRTTLASIRLPAGRAWGDGSHPTTQAALAWLREGAAASFLDVGSGSGIPLLGARRVGFARALGVEVDGVARAECEEAIAADGASSGPAPRVVTSLDALLEEPPFDRALLSIGVAVNRRLLPDVARRLAPSGRLLVGALREGDEERGIIGIARGAGLAPARRLRVAGPAGPPCFGTWIALELTQDAPRADVPTIDVAPRATPAPPGEAPSGTAADLSLRLSVTDPPIGATLRATLAPALVARLGLPAEVDVALEG